MSGKSIQPALARCCPIGAEVLEGDQASFRVWAPARKRVKVMIHDAHGTRELALASEGDGYFSGVRAHTPPGTLYSYRLDDEPQLFPDPASRYQPQGHDGPSQLVNPRAYRWSDTQWQGLRRTGDVIYEMHVGTFTREGTWTAAARALPWLADLGITVLELMPVGEFPGRYGWGYDVVHFFAPTRLYGTPDDMRMFVDTAHRLGMGVVLDVIYNHCGTVGCFLPAFGEHYFSRKWRSEWGHPINFDGEHAKPVREYFKANAEYWIREFHLDGFRFDATQTIFDSSKAHILGELSASARNAARPREVLLIGENEPQHVSLLEARERGGADIDALWNDDFHHTARVALTGRSEAYYMDYRGSPQEFVSCAKRGFLYQGQHYSWQKKPRGTATFGFDAARFVLYLQNHDQVANSARGLRLHEITTPGRYRAATALLLLLPQTPMLFQGQEFAASSPFLYFADNAPANAEVVRNGRREFLSQFPSVAAGGDVWLADPALPETFERCKLDLAEREMHVHAVALHRDLLKLRRDDPVLGTETSVDGAVLGEEAFVLRYFGEQDDDRLLIVNFGRDLVLLPCPEPLLAPVPGHDWKLLWSSEDPRYGGDGTPESDEAAWRVPGHAALVYRRERSSRPKPSLPGQSGTE
jgi:maltooligosyltrehalose trehalohydrolase